MSISNELTRLQSARNKIRNKMTALGLGLTTDNLTQLADKLDLLENQGTVSAKVKEGETYTIPKGYHSGTGTVQGVAGGGNYELQAKTVTPSKTQQSITSDEGYYGLSGVTVTAIPETYQDVSSVTAVAGDVLTGKTIVTLDGVVTAGTMINNGIVNEVLDTAKTSFTIPKGYHAGSGKVTLTVETKSVTPTKSEQTIKPTNGKVLSQVVVGAIPEEYIVTADATAAAENILVEKTAYVNGVLIEGSMLNNGNTSKTMDGLNSTSVTIPAGYTTGGTVSLTDDIETSLAAI